MFFFFNDTATTEIYTLSLHDAFPISIRVPTTVVLGGADSIVPPAQSRAVAAAAAGLHRLVEVPGADHNDRVLLDGEDRKSTRLNSSHANISYAVFCLKKKKKTNTYVS